MVGVVRAEKEVALGSIVFDHPEREEYIQSLDEEELPEARQMSVSIAARLEGGNQGFVAPRGDHIAGYLEIDGDHIRLLFVARADLRQGVARALLRAATKNRAGRTITVHASPYAIPAYERLGFRATTTIQSKNGMTFLPMAITLPPGGKA